MTNKGILVIVSSPSGAGKTTLLERALCNDDRLRQTISATTRPPRSGEVDGRHYYFISGEEFTRRVDSGDFLEWAQVHSNRYGTLRSELKRLLHQQFDVILEIDVQGMRNVKQQCPDAVTVFIMPPSVDELERRLRGRGCSGEEELRIRLENGKEEMTAKKEYDYVIVNDDLDDALREFQEIIQNARNNP